MIKEYLKSISSYSSIIQIHATMSWSNIDFSNSEPNIIRDYLLKPGIGVDYMNKHIASHITANSNYEFKFASIYCHQKPRITRTKSSQLNCTGSTNQCELGDLMLIFILLDKAKNPIFTSAKLLQAKKSDILNSDSQKCLYESDLDFIMPANLLFHSTNSDPLRVLPNYHQHRDNALSYMILNYGDPIIRQIPSSSNLYRYWSTEIQLMIEMKTGLKFAIPNAAENDWNCIVSDLLNVGNGIITSSQIRGAGLDYIINAFNDYGEYEKYNEESNFTGIPKLIIICKDRKRE